VRRRRRRRVTSDGSVMTWSVRAVGWVLMLRRSGRVVSSSALPVGVWLLLMLGGEVVRVLLSWGLEMRWRWVGSVSVLVVRVNGRRRTLLMVVGRLLLVVLLLGGMRRVAERSWRSAVAVGWVSSVMTRRRVHLRRRSVRMVRRRTARRRRETRRRRSSVRDGRRREGSVLLLGGGGGSLGTRG